MSKFTIIQKEFYLGRELGHVLLVQLREEDVRAVHAALHAKSGQSVVSILILHLKVKLFWILEA
jgi:DNA-binding IclR family transcriptional regulator